LKQKAQTSKSKPLKGFLNFYEMVNFVRGKFKKTFSVQSFLGNEIEKLKMSNYSIFDGTSAIN
jgi:hypothetical protein